MTRWMMTCAAAVLLCAGMVWSQTKPKPAPPAVPAGGSGEFQLEVGKTKYDLAPDKPVTIVTPGGEKVVVILRRSSVIKWSANGVSFSYPRDMKATAKQTTGASLIKVESSDSFSAMIQIYDVDTGDAEIRKQLTDAIRKQFESRGGTVSPNKTVKRKIAGAEREGNAMEMTRAGAQAIRTEIYAFARGRTIISIILQDSSKDEAAAKKALAIIVDSLE